MRTLQAEGPTRNVLYCWCLEWVKQERRTAQAEACQDRWRFLAVWQAVGERLHRCICTTPTPANLLDESIRRVFPVLSSLVKPHSRLPGIDSSQMGLHQAEGLLNEVMELVDRGPRINTDNIEGLFET